MKAKSEPKMKRGRTGVRPRVTRPAEALAGSAATHLLDHISDGFVAFDAELNYTYVNKKGGELLGRRPKDLIGKNYWVEYPEARGTPFANASIRALETQTPIVIEEFYGPFDRWFENRIYPSPDGLTIIFTEITARKQAELHMRASEDRLARIVETIPDGIVIADQDGAITFANPPAERILGLTRLDITQRTYNDPQWHITALDGGVFRDDDLPFARVKASGQAVYNVEHAIVYPDGRRVSLSINASPLRDGKGNFDGIVASITDITERWQMENLIQKERAFSEHALNSLPGVFYMYDADRKFLRWNRNFEQVTGYTGAEIASMHPLDFFAGTDKGLLAERIQEVFSLGESSVEADFVAKDGARTPYYFTGRALQVDGQACLIGVGIDIRERKQAEADLRKSQQMFSVIFNKAPFAAALAGLPQGIYQEVNEEFERVFEFNRQEAVGRTSLELGLYPDPEARSRSAAKFREQGFVHNADMTLRTRSGERRDFLVNTDLVEVGGEKYVLMTANNITERKRAEDKLRLSEERFSKAFHASPAGLTLTRIADGKFIDVNESFCKMFEFTRAEAIEHTSTELNMWTLEERQRLIHAQVAVGGLQNFELQARSKSGRVVTILFSSKPIVLDGEPCLITTMIDITDRKRVDEALRESEERYRLLVERSPYAIGVHQGGKLVFANPAAIHLFGAHTLDELIGQPVLELVSPETREAARERIGRMLQGETGWYPTEDRYQQLDGTVVPVEVIAAPFTHDGRPAIQVIARDITERKRAEAEVRLSRDRLAELSRRLVEAHETEQRAIGRELHDQIGQMLTAVKLILEIAPQLPSEASTKKLAQAHDLVEDLMSRVSRLSLELRPPMLDDLGLVPALLWHLNRYQEQAGVKVDFQHSGVEGQRFGAEIETTVYRLVQEALTNVARHARATQVNVNLYAEGKQLNIHIQDNGVGFDPPVALAENRGLGGMRERVRLLGGSFEIASQTGQGTQKSIRLPLKEKTT